MAFSAKKWIEDRLTAVDDQIKQLLKQRDANAAAFDAQLKELLLEREEWSRLTAPVEDPPAKPEPAKPVAKKAAAKK